ncbi:MAG: transporter substrate-binding protein, partial [Sinobacterium sp.]
MRNIVKKAVAVSLSIALSASVMAADTIKVGVLHSLSGTMAISETTLKDTVLILKEKLDSTALSNAKLIYTNKALSSDSLNERQKQKLAEAISNAENIE